MAEITKLQTDHLRKLGGCIMSMSPSMWRALDSFRGQKSLAFNRRKALDTFGFRVLEGLDKRRLIIPTGNWHIAPRMNPAPGYVDTRGWQLTAMGICVHQAYIRGFTTCFRS